MEFADALAAFATASVEFRDLCEKVACEIFRVGVFRDRSLSESRKGFRLKLHEKDPDAPLSPFYFNLRSDNPKPGPLTLEIIPAISALFYGMACMRQLKFDHVAGIPRAGNPFASTLSRLDRNPMSLLTLGKTEEGGSRQIGAIESGKFEEGDTVLLIDDLITQADSKLEAIKSLETAGLRVTDVLVFLDREQGGARALRAAGYNLHAVFTITELLDLYLEERLLSDSIHGEIKAYLAR